MENGNTRPVVLLEDETLRDGLQVESRIFTLEEKLAIYEQLKAAGVRRIQVGSFVHPQRVPQMADTDELIRTINAQREGGPLLSALILNDKGLERALACGVKHVSMSVSASNTHSRKNAGKDSHDALASMSELITSAVAAGMTVRAGIQCAFGCVYEGAVPHEAVIAIAEKLALTGASEVNLADSTGMATPPAIFSLVSKVRDVAPDMGISLHLHDTRGMGMVNLFAGYRVGVRTFDVCAGGLGGCPFIRGAAGNVALEDAVNMFNSIGVDTGIDVYAVCDTVAHLQSLLGRELPGKMSRVVAFERNNG
mgnify:CR=1 FL=1